MKYLKLLIIPLILSIFIFSSIPLNATTAVLTTYETYTTGGNGDSANIYNSNIVAEQFTTGTTVHSITQIILPFKMTGVPLQQVVNSSSSNTQDPTPTVSAGTSTSYYTTIGVGTITIEIRAVDGSNNPILPALSTGTLQGSQLTNAYVYYPVQMTNFVPLASTAYAIVVSAVGDASDYINWQLNTAGGLASAVGLHSTDSGVSWASDTPKDLLFTVQGYPVMSFVSAKVISDYINSGDLLVVAECINTYEPYNTDGESASLYFSFNLLDTTGATILFSTPFTQFGDAPESIYIGATQATALTKGAAYIVQIKGLFSPYPYLNYTLQPKDWLGSNLTYLDNWVISTATHIGSYYSKLTGTTVSLIDYVPSFGQQLNAIGAATFDIGIPSLASVRPNLIENAVYQPNITNHTPNPTTNFDTASTYQVVLGTPIANALDSGATLVGGGGLSGKDFGAIIGWIVYLVVAIFFFGKGQFTAGLGLAFPIIGLDVYFRLLGMQWIVGIAAIFLFLFIWSFWWSRT